MTYRFISMGATGYTYQIDQFTVVKLARPRAIKEFHNEITAFDTFRKQKPSPYVIQYFFHTSGAIFLPYLCGGSLEDRLQHNQIRKDGLLVRVVKQEPIQLVERWTMEIAAGSAWIENLGYIHGDLRPANLLLDAEEHLKLTDFDCAEKIGTPASGHGPPWARLLGPEAGDEEGTWGVNGPRLEQFTIGSVVYCITRGRQPYEGEIEDGPKQVEMLQAMEFPELGDGQLDTIIRRCWHGAFRTLQDLASETSRLKGALGDSSVASLSEEFCRMREDVCRDYVQKGQLPPTPTA